MWVEVGVCPGKGQRPLPGVQWAWLALVVNLQPGAPPTLLRAGSALKGNALRVEGNHTPNSGFHGDGRQAAWLLPVSARCDCNRRTFVLWVILPVAVLKDAESPQGMARPGLLGSQT